MSNEIESSGSITGLIEELCNNIDSVVTIYTDGGCFTGLLVAINNCLVKLITRSALSSCPYRNFFGRTTLIPLNEIVAVTFCNASI